MKTTLNVQIEYDPAKTDPEGLACAMDRLLETALSTPDLLDEYGNPKIGEFVVVEDMAAPPAPQFVLNIFGGVLQDVFGSYPAANIILCDWDMEGFNPSDNGVVEIPDEKDSTQFVKVEAHPVLPLKELLGTETETALKAAGFELTQPHRKLGLTESQT